MTDLYIGIMSGTSMDAVDAVIVSLHEPVQIIDSISLDFPQQLHADILELIKSSQSSLSHLGYIDIALAELYAQAVTGLLNKANIQADQITAIGCHGQTVHHQPEGEYRFSTQLGSGSYLAEKTSITTVTDFRNRDMAAGGQGAPLVPAAHRAFFEDGSQNRMIVNIGGIANCTLLPTEGDIIGFDIGPGNTLMDSWIYQNKGHKYDQNGEWAASGNISKPLLAQLLMDDYFSQSSPKSTGREYFNLDWLENRAKGMLATLKPEDIQATLLEVTAQTISTQLNKYISTDIYLCGGGVHNVTLINRIKQLSNNSIKDIEQLGIHPDLVEAASFAWLAMRCINRQTGTLNSVTGANHSVITGAIYLA